MAEERAEAYRRAMYSNSLAMANEAINENSIARAQKLLNSCEQELRGWEWQRLNYTVDESTMTFQGHSDEINSVAVSPDGKRIASVSDDNTDQVIDAISQVSNTGKIGDGKIFVSSLEQVVRIRTGELNEDAL